MLRVLTVRNKCYYYTPTKTKRCVIKEVFWLLNQLTTQWLSCMWFRFSYSKIFPGIFTSSDLSQIIMNTFELILIGEYLVKICNSFCYLGITMTTKETVLAGKFCVFVLMMFFCYEQN